MEPWCSDHGRSPDMCGRKSHRLQRDLPKSGGVTWMQSQWRGVAVKPALVDYSNWTDYVYGFGDLGGNFGTGWRRYTASPHKMMWSCTLNLGMGPNPPLSGRTSCSKWEEPTPTNRLTISQDIGWEVYMMHWSSAMWHNSALKDRDHDIWDRNCTTVYGGAWWHNACFNAI